jgi:cytochrome c553
MRPYLSLLFLLSASLTACDTSTSPASKDQPTTAAPVVDEVSLIAGCNSCHGENGVGSNPEVPFIAGQHATYLESAMRGYLIGDRKHTPMRTAVFDLDVDERHQLAEHFAQLDSPWKANRARTKNAGAADKQQAIRAGKALSRPCTSCHGNDGNSIKEGVPSLAGLQPEYFIPALKSYLNGERKGAAIMKNFKLSLREREIRQLAAYFAAQKRIRSPLGTRHKASEANDELVHRCLGCHGDDGNSSHPAMPSLAGQNAAYLIKAMQTYRDKKRQNKMMVDIAQGLSDKAIRQNAIYFATRTPVAVSQQESVGQPQFAPLAEGEKLAASCNGCHGDQGNSKTAGTPRLAGLSETYLQAAITDYRDGKRQHGMMQMLTRYLSETDIEKIALYYASQTPASRTEKTTTAGAEIASSCAGCHGEDGNSETAGTPSLAGQDANYIVAALSAYKNESRQNGDMKGAAEELDKKTMKKLADYYSRLVPKESPVHNMEAPDVLAQKCNRCHGEDGKKPDADKPRIAGQRQAYLVNALLAYKNKQRINSMMNNMVAELSRVEIEAISAYYASK